METRDIDPEALPLLHGNGSGARNLIEWRQKAVHALDDALKLLGEAYPNMRDYYPIPQRWGPACDAWTRRIEAVRCVIGELNTEILALADQADAMGVRR